MSPILVEALGSIVRTGLAFLAGSFIDLGIWTSEDATKYVAAASAALLTLGWSLWQKYQSRNTLHTALAAAMPMTENDAKAKAKRVAPPVTTQADVIPRVGGSV